MFEKYNVALAGVIRTVEDMQMLVTNCCFLVSKTIIIRPESLEDRAVAEFGVINEENPVSLLVFKAWMVQHLESLCCQAADHDTGTQLAQSLATTNQTRDTQKCMCCRSPPVNYSVDY